MRKRTNEFRKGDVYRALRDNEIISHVWIIMQDCMDGHGYCTRAFNLTGSNTNRQGVHMINVSHHNFPSDWFRKKKKYTYARINKKDCLKKGNTLEYLGNIEESCPGFMNEVCQETYACEIATDLKEICDCNYQIINKKIELKQIEVPVCECNSMVYFIQTLT
jgi:hypothetical protein